MRSFVAAAVAAVALASSASAQTCSNANLAFVTSTTGQFTTECAASVTADTLAPYGVAVTTLLDPEQSTNAFLLSDLVKTKLNAVLDKYANVQGKSNRTNAGWPAYPFGTNPLVSNFSDTALWPGMCYVAELGGNAPCGQPVNQTVSGGAAFILCPVLKNVVKDLLACIPKNCSSLVSGLCANPTPANAAALMGTYANTPFVTGTLTMFGAINALCGGAQQALAGASFYNSAGIATGDFNYTCADLAPASAIGTFTYSSTNSPTQSAAAEVGVGAAAAVAALAAAAFAF